MVWQTRVGKGGVNGGVQWGMASDGKHVYAAVSDVVRIRKTNADPTDPARFSLNPQEGGGLTALRVETARRPGTPRHPRAARNPGAAPRSRRPSQQFPAWFSPVRLTVTCAPFPRRTARCRGTSIPCATTTLSTA